MKRMRLVDIEKVIIEQVEKPVPQKDEVLIKVHKVGVCGTDIHAYYGKHPYIHCPIVLGHEFSGTIESTGEDVKELKAGEKVTVIPHLGCGECDACKRQAYNYCQELKCIGCQATGAYSEYITVPAKLVVTLPEEVSFETGAMVEPASVAYHGIKRGMKRGDNVLIMGAGPIGIMAAQFAKALGAKKVAIADIKVNRLALAKKLGVDGTIDLQKDILEERLEAIFGDTLNVDFFGDYVGAGGEALDSIIRVAKRGARITLVGIIANDYSIPHLPDIIEHELTVFGSSMYVPQDYRDVIDFIARGRLKTDGLVTHYFDLADIPKMYQIIAEKKEDFIKIMINI